MERRVYLLIIIVKGGTLIYNANDIIFKQNILFKE
jgi:hypothetical protein